MSRPSVQSSRPETSTCPELRCPLDHLANDGLKFAPRMLRIFSSYVSDETLCLVIGDQVHGPAAEARADQPRTQAAGMLARQFHQQIQFRGAVRGKIARAFVALGHILPE